MKKKRGFPNIANIDLTAQNKLIIIGFIASTIIIVAVALISMTQIKDRLYSGYADFGQLLTKTLAIETSELMRDLNEESVINVIKNQANAILKNNRDISYITIKDTQGKILHSTEDDYPARFKATKTTVSSQMEDKSGKKIGLVEIGLSDNMAGAVIKTTRNSMLAVFTLVWVVFTLVTVMNTFFITRELTLLHHGVKEISSGKFGTMLDYSQTSGETKELFAAFNDMSKRLHAYEEQNIDTLTLEKNKLEAVLMSIANGVVVCDNFDKITIINNSAQKILGVSAGEIINSHIQNYCDTNGELCFKEKITLFKNTPLEIMEKKPLEFNISIDTRTIKSIMSPIYSKMHDYLGYIIILIDITKEAEVDKLKNDFISNVSHELRTPVTVLRSYADTLYNFGQDFNFEEQKEFIGTINQEVIRLNKMVNDVLDFSKLQNDNVLEKIKQDITQTIEETLASLKVLADEKEITFSMIKEPNLPEIHYNKESIERVLSNLITNAIKYSHNNSRVKIRAEVAKNPDFVEITIEDFGVGIAPEHLEKIYDRFYRIENDTHTIKGTGLGLHLVKIAIEKHHQGEVFVNSKINEGSTFGFRLPVKLSEKEEIIISAKEQLQEDITQHQKIVEDFVPKMQENSETTTVATIAKTEEENAAHEEQKEKISQVQNYELDINDDEQKEVPIDKKPENDWEISFEIREKA